MSSHRRHSWHGWHVDNPKQLLQIWNSVRFRAQQRTQPTQKDTYETSSCCFNHDCGLTKSHFADPLHMFLSISRPWFIGVSFWGESPSNMSRWECNMLSSGLEDLNAAANLPRFGNLVPIFMGNQCNKSGSWNIFDDESICLYFLKFTPFLLVKLQPKLWILHLELLRGIDAGFSLGHKKVVNVTRLKVALPILSFYKISTPCTWALGHRFSLFGLDKSKVWRDHRVTFIGWDGNTTTHCWSGGTLDGNPRVQVDSGREGADELGCGLLGCYEVLR